MGESGEEELGIGKGDKLILRGLKFHGFHGVKEEEKKLGQKFLVDVDAWLDLRKAGKTDCLSDTVSYTAIYRSLLLLIQLIPLSLLMIFTKLGSFQWFDHMPIVICFYMI